MKRWLLLLLLAVSPLGAVDFSGHVKSFLIHEWANALGNDRGRFDNTARVTAQLRPEAFRAEFAYALAITLRKPQAFTLPTTPLIGPRPALYRLIDLEAELFNDGADMRGIQNLDRTYFSFSPSWAEIHLGRQPIAFGVARVINPTDIIAPFTFDTIDQEHRIGVDAARVTVPLGDLSELDCGFISGRNACWKESALFLRARGNLQATDISLIAIAFRENGLIGLDLERGLWQAGFWLEAAYVFGGQAYARLSTGLDYNITPTLYVYGEYHYSSAGTTERRDYLFNVMRPAYTQGSVYLLGEHYFIPGLAFELTPLSNVSSQLLWNLTDHSAYWISLIEQSLTEDLYLDGSVYISLGTGQGREFGFYPTLAFASLRYYF